MRFADYFGEAIKYGESLGLKLGSYKANGTWVQLDEIGNGKSTPVIYASTAWGLTVNGGTIVVSQQQLKLVSMFVTAYEQYLADKKEPVAADSSK